MKTIVKSVLGLVFVSSVFCGLPAKSALAWSSGPPAYRTGAPGDEGACNSCHSTYSLDSGSAGFSITGPDSYRPGETIRLEVSFDSASGKRHGFEMTALDADENRIGKFKAVGKTSQVIPPGDYRGLEKADKGKYIEHTAKGSKKKSWKVKWTAPASASGTVTFYASGNDANGDGKNSGDYIYTTTREIPAASGQ